MGHTHACCRLPTGIHLSTSLCSTTFMLTYCIDYDSDIRLHANLDSYLLHLYLLQARWQSPDNFLIIIVFASLFVCFRFMMKDCNLVKWASWPNTSALQHCSGQNAVPTDQCCLSNSSPTLLKSHKGSCCIVQLVFWTWLLHQKLRCNSNMTGSNKLVW